MYESALKQALSLFKVPRSQQQFPYVPFVFGAYELPEMPKSTSIFPQPYIDSCYVTYSIFIEKYLAKKTEELVGCVHSSLLAKCEKSITRLESAGITIKENPAPDSTCVFNLIAERELYGKRFRYPELEIPSDMHADIPRLVFNSLYEQLYEAYSRLMAQNVKLRYEVDLDPVTIIYKKRMKQQLTSNEESDYKLFQQHLVDVGIVTHQVLIASRDVRSFVMTNKRGEEIDGETEPNVHILAFEKVSTLRRSHFLTNHFLLDEWMLVDIDFMQYEEGFS